MKKKAAFLMDPLSTLNEKKDSTLAIAECARARGWKVFYATLSDLFVHKQQLCLAAQTFPATPGASSSRAFKLSKHQFIRLDILDYLFIRKNPPLDAEYLHALQLLQQFSSDRTQLINKPKGLMCCNEKLFVLRFTELIPPTVVTSLPTMLDRFLEEHREIVVKPLDGMGGTGIFLVKEGDLNRQVIWETVTQGFRHLCLAQRYLPEIKEGDRRVLMLDGVPVPHALVRLPRGREFRANLAVGGVPQVALLRPVDRAIAEQVGPSLVRLGLRIVGLDIIGSYLTEINVTSPTGIRELQAVVHTPWLDSWLGGLDDFQNYSARANRLSKYCPPTDRSGCN